MVTDATPAAPAPEAEAPAPPQGRGRLLIIVAAAVAVLAGLGGGAWFLAPRVFGSATPAAASAPPPVKATVPLGAVVVNANGDVRRYVRVGVSFGVPAPADVKEIEEHRSQLLDVVISVFAATDVDKLLSENGKVAVKTALLARIREDLRLHKVTRVYFTELVIQ